MGVTPFDHVPCNCIKIRKTSYPILDPILLRALDTLSLPTPHYERDLHKAIDLTSSQAIATFSGIGLTPNQALAKLGLAEENARNWADAKRLMSAQFLRLHTLYDLRIAGDHSC